MSKYKAVIFDVDGTLLDTSEGVLASVKYTIKKFGFRELSDEKLRTFIGPPIQRSFAQHYNLEGDIIQDIATVFRNRYKDYDLLKAVPYDGIFELMDSLGKAGIKVAVATYKRQDYAEKIMREFGFYEYTDIVCGADHENKLSKKDIICNALKLCGIDNYKDAVMVGDSDNDAIGASQIGADFVGVTYGFGFKTKQDVMEFDNIGAADTTDEVLDIIINSAGL